MVMAASGGLADDADGRQRVGFGVALDPVAIVVAGAGEADHLPCGHIAVAAIDGIGEEALPRVGQHLLEKGGGARALECYRAVFERAEHLVLLIVGQLGKRLADIGVAAVLVQLRQRLPIALRRGQRRLRALLRRSVHEGRPYIESLGAAILACLLTIDEDCATDFFSTRRLRVWRNQPVDDGFDGAGFLRREVLPCAGLNRRRRRAGARRPRQPAGDDAGSDRGRRKNQAYGGACQKFAQNLAARLAGTSGILPHSPHSQSGGSFRAARIQGYRIAHTRSIFSRNYLPAMKLNLPTPCAAPFHPATRSPRPVRPSGPLPGP